jgi:hypothetical protein
MPAHPALVAFLSNKTREYKRKMAYAAKKERYGVAANYEQQLLALNMVSEFVQKLP